MGYLTTFTVYNDGIDCIRNNSDDFAKKIITAMECGNPSEIPIGNFANLIRVQKCRHADDNTIYIHMGNTVFEMNPNSQETKKLLKINPNFFKKAVSFLEETTDKVNASIKGE